MKNKLTYLNTLLTIIAIALTVIILQNAHVIQPVKASVTPQTVDVNITEINGWGFMGTYVPVEIR